MPILGYNVNITNVDTNSTRSIFINDTTLNISLGYNYMVSIAGVNIVGEGNETIVFVDSTKLANKCKYYCHCVCSPGYGTGTFTLILPANSYLVVIAELESNYMMVRFKNNLGIKAHPLLLDINLDCHLWTAV